MKSYSQTQNPALFRISVLLGVLFASAALLQAQPTDNPVATQYPEGYPVWTDSINWSNVVDVTSQGIVSGGDHATNGAANFNAFEAIRDNLYAAGGGVMYFPVGQYYFRLPDAGYGPGIGPLSRGLMLKKGVVIRGAAPYLNDAISRNSSDFKDVTHNLFNATEFIFEFQARGTTPAGASSVTDAWGNTGAGFTPMDWNFVGITAQGTSESGVSEVDNVGIVNVELVGGTIVFGFDCDWNPTVAGAKWEGNNFKVDWPAGSAVNGEDWINRVPNGEHYMDLLNGRTGWHTLINSGTGRLVMNTKITDGATWTDMTYVDRRPKATTATTESAFAHYRFAGRIIAYGSDIFIANNVIAQPTKTFVHDQLSDVGVKTVLFDYANHIGVDVNKSLLGANQGHHSVHGLDGQGYYASNVVVRDNWVFNRGDKGFEIAGRHVVIFNNHNERHYAGKNTHAFYIANPEAYAGTVGTNYPIDMGGFSFDGYRWQTSESASDFLARGYDLAGMDVWVDSNSVVNTGSIGNDGEGILGQRSNNVEVLSWALTNNENGKLNRGPGTLGEDGYIAPYDMHSIGLFLMGNTSTGAVGIFKASANYILDATWFDNTATQATPASTHSDNWIAPGKTSVPHSDPVVAPVLSATKFPGRAVELSWADNSSNELGFRVERMVSGGSWEVIAYRPRSDDVAGTRSYDGAPLSINSTGWDPASLSPSTLVAPDTVAFAISDPDIELTFDSSVGMPYQAEASIGDLASWQRSGITETGTGSPITLDYKGIAPATGEKVFLRMAAPGLLNSADVVQTQWIDYNAPMSQSVDYRVVAINQDDDLSTGVSNVVTVAP